MKAWKYQFNYSKGVFLAKEKKKKTKIISSLISLFTAVIALILIFITVIIGVVMYFNSPVPESKRPAVFSQNDAIRMTDDGNYLIDIRKGESSQSVGLRLERTGLISSRYFWNIICRFGKNQIKTGTYKIITPASQIAIYRILTSGQEVLYKVTIPEGVTLKKMAKIIEEAGICSAEDFLSAANNMAIVYQYLIPNQSMEGYLFPDTYFFPSEYPAQKVITTMADTFFNNLKNINPSILTMNPNELNEKIIIASIVEREYRMAQEAPLMAGVFYNRLRINMALQSCATVEYIITEIQNLPHPSVLLFKDLEIDNPYNTYIKPGLPPGPISAPGITALQAAFNPESTNYLYFRLEDVASGRHYFSRTYDEHIKAGQLITKPSWL
jgi:UPF0755 protein